MNILASLLVIKRETHALNVRYATDTNLKKYLSIFHDRIKLTSVVCSENNKFIYKTLMLKAFLLY